MGAAQCDLTALRYLIEEVGCAGPAFHQHYDELDDISIRCGGYAVRAPATITLLMNGLVECYKLPGLKIKTLYRRQLNKIAAGSGVHRLDTADNACLPFRKH